jgi:hypothetical protein
MRAPEQFPPLHADALAALEGEPLPQVATARAILTGPMRVDFDGDGALREGFLACIPVDLAAQLVRPLAVHAPRFAAPFGFDFAQALKEQHTARIPGTYIGNAARHLVSRVLIQVINMSPELLVAVLPLDRLTRLPLLLRNAPQMPIAVLIEPVIGDKDGLQDDAMLANRDDGEIAHIEVDGDRHQISIKLAVFDFLRRDLFALRNMQFRRLCPQDQDGTLLLPGLIALTLLEVAAAHHGIVHPAPRLAIVDLEPHKPLLHLSAPQLEGVGSLVECRVIRVPRQPWLPFFLAARFPLRSMRQIRAHFADGILDHASAVDERQIGKAFAEVPA